MNGPSHRLAAGHLARRATPRLVLLTFAVVAAVALAAPLGAGAAAPSALSPRLLSLASPAVRSLSPVQQSRQVGLAARGPGSLLRHGPRVIVDVRFADGVDGGAEAIRAAGAGIVSVSPRYDTVTAAALPADLPRLAEAPGVSAISEEITPLTRATCPSGAIVSEGDLQLEAARARGDFAVDGTGVTVGILSDSFDQWAKAPVSAAGDISTGDLPGPGNPCGQPRPVGVLQPFVPGAYPEPGEEPENPPEEVEPTADEGRAMTQIVHDLAPGANLDFASAFNGELSFANNIRALYNAGARVIADDVVYFDEPFYQDGPIAVAVNEVTAGGASYFSSAGNDNMFSEAGEGEGEIASWEAPAFRPTPCPAGTELPKYEKTCMDFNPGTGKDPTMGITVEEEAPLFVDLQWAQPWNGVTTDFDMYLLNEEGEVVETAFNTANTEPNRQEPYEFIPWEKRVEEEAPEEEVQLVIARCDAACGVTRAKQQVDKNGMKDLEGTKGGDTGAPRLKVGLFENGGGVSEVEYPESEGGDIVGPTIFGHTAAASAISVGAIEYATKEEPEYYSSRGPVTHYFGPVTGTAAAPPIGAQVIPKPNVTATDCGLTTFFYGLRPGGYRFCGTSAAAPHAAAVAALIRSANPTATNAQVRAALEETALPIGAFGHEAIGAGLLDADTAVARLALPPQVSITARPAALSRIREPVIGFTANRPAAFRCTVDGGTPIPCTSPFQPPELEDGTHSFSVAGTDLAGRSGSAAVSFRVDATAPKAKFAKHPKKLVKTRKRTVKLGFRFGASESKTTFRCRVDKGKFHKCGKRIAPHFRAGAHAVAVRATDAAGNVSRPVAFHFRVKRLH